MNVLLTCAGRRTSLLQAFDEAARAHRGRVYVADADPLAPCCLMAHKALAVPSLSHPSYLADLLEQVRAHDLRLIVPTIDPELLALAEARADFEAHNCQVAVSTPDFVRTCADKHHLLAVLRAERHTTVPTWLPDALPTSLPERLFVKPRTGAASQLAFDVSRENLPHALALVPDPVVQPFIKAPELTIDALFDFSGRLMHYVPRRRLRTLAGESIQGVTVDDEPFCEALRALLRTAGRLGARGPITVQAFSTNEGLLFSEINPRFGGGFPLARAAGGHYPRWLLDLARGSVPEVTLGDYRRDRCMTRFYDELFINRPGTAYDG